MGAGYRVLLAGALTALIATCIGMGWIYGSALQDPNQDRYQPYRYASDKPLEIDPSASRGTHAQAFEYRSPCDDPIRRLELRDAQRILC